MYVAQKRSSVSRLPIRKSLDASKRDCLQLKSAWRIPALETGQAAGPHGPLPALEQARGANDVLRAIEVCQVGEDVSGLT